jgi:hypothetical protein
VRHDPGPARVTGSLVSRKGDRAGGGGVSVAGRRTGGDPQRWHALEREFAGIIESSGSAGTGDEHDPEGADAGTAAS